MMRRWAMWILRRTVACAPAERQEWGRAMMREVDFVEGDWAALWWALGCARSVLRAFDGPIRSADDILPGIRALGKETQARTFGGYVVCLMVIASSVLGLFLFRTPVQQVGCWLTLAAAVFMVYQLYRAREGERPATESATARLEFYRAELKRQRDFHRGKQLGARCVALIPGYVLFCAASAVTTPAEANGFVWAMILFFALLVLAIPANLRLARKYQRRIDEVHGWLG